MSTDEVVEIIAALYDKKQDLLHLKALFRINISSIRALKYKKTGSINLIPGFLLILYHVRSREIYHKYDH